jgi:hypothetical protein
MRAGLTSASGTVWWLAMSTAPLQFLPMLFAGCRQVRRHRSPRNWSPWYGIVASGSRRPATENPTWGYTRIRDVLGALGHVPRPQHDQASSGSTVSNPRPCAAVGCRATFLNAHLGSIAVTVFTIEVLTLGGLVRYFVLFVICGSSSAPAAPTRIG